MFLMDNLPESYKPQYAFRSQPLDNSTAPFVPPFVKFDSNAALKEGHSGRKKGGGQGDELKKDRDSKHEKEKHEKSNKRAKLVSPHPFGKKMMESVAANVAKRPFSSSDVMMYKPMDETPFTFVDTEKELLAVAERFSKCTEIAIDLEHHDCRSFLGFTCLIQMSTREEDVVFDAIKIWSEKIHSSLAGILADPAITKVMHCAFMDVVWLERDFGLYVVNMFDTNKAAHVLKHPGESLAYLLNLYCQTKMDGKKAFQCADWRIRPLPQSMMNYARSDTHYLLYIYDRLRVELYEKNGDEVAQVYELSAKVARRRYTKPPFVPGRALDVATNKRLGFDKYQVAILESLFQWRDGRARKEDESPAYLARDDFLITLARAKSSACTPDGLLRALGSAGSNARFLNKYRVEIAKRIAETLDSDVAPLPEKKTPRGKTVDSISQSSTPSKGGAKTSNNLISTSPQDSKVKVTPTKSNPSASVFTPSKASKSKLPVRVRGKKT